MFCEYNPAVQSSNYVDGVIFTRDDPCLWVVYPGGAAGDLLISILDKHYLRTGCEYFGINDRGRVMLNTTDCEMIDLENIKNNQSNGPGSDIDFNDQWFYRFSDSLGSRNLSYSMLDQVILGCHLYRPRQILHILNNFGRAKIICIHAKDSFGQHILESMNEYKLHNKDIDSITNNTGDRCFASQLVDHDRVLNVPFGFLFDKASYDRYYHIIRQFLGLAGPLICHDFIEFYLSKQNPKIAEVLRNYSKSL